MRKIAEKRFRTRDCSSKTQMEAYIKGISFRKIGKGCGIFSDNIYPIMIYILMRATSSSHIKSVFSFFMKLGIDKAIK
jgi:hypothetical protein